MRDPLLFALAGFAASLVDGALGMGFGPTSSSILLGVGLAPTAVSASVNLAKVVTGLVAGFSHWKFHNLDRGLVLRLALPGCVGALFGVTVLSNINGATLRPYLAMLLTIIGLRILVRFARPLPRMEKATVPIPGSLKRELRYDRRGVKVAAFLGGVTNGMIGAWGPVVTPFLLHRGVRPRYAIGCVNTAEIAVASTSAFSLIASLGTAGVNGSMLLAMLLGGVVAAPAAACLIRYVPPGPMGVAVAGLLLLTNARELIAWVGLAPGPATWASIWELSRSLSSRSSLRSGASAAGPRGHALLQSRLACRLRTMAERSSRLSRPTPRLACQPEVVIRLSLACALR